ncbi:MAG: hypothetical protein WD773_04750 [Gemmatimonadales bacterium]
MRRSWLAALLLASELPAQELVPRLPTDTPPTPPRLMRPASLALRPLVSLLVPGTGQLLAGQDRGAVYLAAEVYLVSRFLQLDREAGREAEHFQALAYEVARRLFTPTRRDTVFEYYEQMERFVESGRYDADPGDAFVPETDPRTYNGSVWLLARRTYWEDPDVPPDPMSLQYWNAVKFYQARAVGPEFMWTWRDHSLEHQVFRESIRRSDNAFRRAQNQVGLLLANHIVSAVDALISSRLAAVAGRPAAVRTTVGPGGAAQVRFTLTF